MGRRPITGDEAGRSAVYHWSTSYVTHLTTPCGACRPSPRWPRHFPMDVSAGQHLPASSMTGVSRSMIVSRTIKPSGWVDCPANAERAMRCVALGRKNWLFAGSKAGGDRAAAIYTVIETAKLNGLEPQAYIADVIAKIAGGWPASRWDELMPWNWKAQQDLDKLATKPTGSSHHAYSPISS